MMRRFFAPKKTIIDGRVTLGPEESRHSREVLRLRQDDVAAVFDGEGHEYIGRVAVVSRSAVEIAGLQTTAPAAPESPLAITLAAALLKGDKFDLVVQKAVELGVTRIIPFLSARCDVKPRENSPRVERWRKIALEATKQCGRAKLAVIDEPEQWSRLILRESAAGKVLMFSERGGGKLPNNLDSSGLTVFVGPEGGWDDSEIEAAQAADALLVTIGGRILRAETAAIALTAIVQNRFGDMN